MASFRRFVSVALSAVFALSLLLVASLARADHGWKPGRPAKTPVTVTMVTPSPVSAKPTLQLTPPANGSVYVYDGASPVGALTATGSVQVEADKEYTLTALRGTKTIWSAPIAVSGAGLQMVWVDGKNAPVISALATPAQPPVVVTLPSRPGAGGPRPPVVAVVTAAPKPMSDTAFAALLALVEEKSFDSSRMEVIKAAAGSGHFTVAQVSKLLAKLSFDSNRLDTLKAIHTRITDRENGVLLSKSFTFSSSQSEALKLFQTPTSI